LCLQINDGEPPPVPLGYLANQQSLYGSDLGTQKCGSAGSSIDIEPASTVRFSLSDDFGTYSVPRASIGTVDGGYFPGIATRSTGPREITLLVPPALAANGAAVKFLPPIVVDKGRHHVTLNCALPLKTIATQQTPAPPTPTPEPTATPVPA